MLDASTKTNLHITSHSATVRYSGNEIIIEDGEVVTQVELARLNAICLHGKVEITTPTIIKLAKYKIPILFFSTSGKLRSVTNQIPQKGLTLRRSQHTLDSLNSTASRAIFAQELVRAKLAGCARLLHNYRRLLGKDSTAWQEVWSESNNQNTVETLLGIEGSAARKYWQHFKTMLQRDHQFNTRQSYPPTGPVNSLLSYGYSILTGMVHAKLLAHGFETAFGHLHSTDESRPTLALDLVEPFRALAVDRFVLRSWNTGVFDAEDFKQTDKGCWLTSPARRIFLHRFHTSLLKPLRKSLIPEGMQQASILDAIEHNIDRYKLWLQNPQTKPEQWPPSPKGMA